MEAGDKVEKVVVSEAEEEDVIRNWSQEFFWTLGT